MEEKKTYIIPRNHTSFFSVGEMIKTRNLAEAAIITFLLCRALSFIPFVRNIKIGVIVVLGAICFIVFFVGYNDESILSYLQGYIKYKIFSGIRRIKIPERNIAQQMKEEEQVQSYYEKFVNRIKRRED